MSEKLLASLLSIMLVALFTAACTVTLTSPPPSMANPASGHCEDEGGTVDIRNGEDGGEVGYCQFEDGTECEEWAFFRGDCRPGDFPASTQLANPASKHCLDKGGTLEIREHDDEVGQYGVCVFEDGSECEEWALFRGQCAPGGTE